MKVTTTSLDGLLLRTDLFRSARNEDRTLCLGTRYRGKDGLDFGVQVHSQEDLSICLPRKAAMSLLRRYPDAFRISQDADDGVVLLFERTRLVELADVLRLKRKRRVSASERSRLMGLTMRFSPFINGSYTNAVEGIGRKDSK